MADRNYTVSLAEIEGMDKPTIFFMKNKTASELQKKTGSGCDWGTRSLATPPRSLSSAVRTDGLEDLERRGGGGEVAVSVCLGPAKIHGWLRHWFCMKCKSHFLYLTWNS